MRFNGFNGNQTAKELIASFIDSGRIPHALLIEGPKGSGRHALANIIAQSIVCNAETDEKPCGKCSHCKKALGSGHPDIQTYSAGSARSFSVKTVRSIRSEAFISPNEADFKIYILLNVHNMTESAQNALLKILEEPPQFVCFILTCNSKSELLETVKSRCQIISLSAENSDKTAEFDELKENSPQADPGKSKDLTDSQSFEKAAVIISDIAKALCGVKEYNLLKISGRLENNADLLNVFFELLLLFFRDAMSYKHNSEVSLSGFRNDAMSLSKKLTPKQIFSLLETTLEARKAADTYANTTLLLTRLFSSLWSDVHN